MIKKCKICCYDCIAAWLNEECKMNKEEYEIRIERYQTIIEDLYAALCELKQKNEQNEAEIRRLIDCIKRNSEEEYD